MASEIRVDKINSLSGVGTVTLSPTGVDIAGITTAATLRATTGIVTSLTAVSSAKVGSGVTLSPDGDVFFTGIATGNGSGLTALNASNISSGTVPTARLGSGTASSSTFLRGDSTFAAVTSTTINSNTNNYLITGTGTADTLQGESGLTYDGDNLNLSAGAHDSGMTITAANNNQETKLNIKGKASDGTVHTVSLTAKRSANRGDIEVGGAVRISMTSDGYIGINQSAPTSELQVGGGTNPMTAKPTLHVAPSSGNAAMSLRGGSPSIYFDGTSGGHTRFLTDGTDIAISNGNLDSAGSERFRFRADGGLCFGGDTAAANGLDDYEEGTWTPGASGFTISSTISARYTKIGRMVTVNAYLNAATGSGSSAVVITNLPYNQYGNSNYHYGSGRIGSAGGNTNSANNIVFQVQQNTNQIKIYVADGGINEGMISGQHIIFSATYEAS